MAKNRLGLTDQEKEEVRGENKLPLEERRVVSSQNVIHTHCEEMGK